MYSTYIKEIDNEVLADRISKTLCWPVDLLFCEVEFDVNYKILGKYIPASYYEPADYPELDIGDIVVERINGCKITKEQEKKLRFIEESFTDDDFEKIEACCWEAAECSQEDCFYGDY